MSGKFKLKPIHMFQLPNQLLIFAGHETFGALRKIFNDYKLILFHSGIDCKEYSIKQEGVEVGKLVSYHSGSFGKPLTEIRIGAQYQDEVLNSIGTEPIRHKCSICGSEKTPVAKRASISPGRRPYSAELSYNCPDCGIEIWPRRLKKSK